MVARRKMTSNLVTTVTRSTGRARRDDMGAPSFPGPTAAMRAAEREVTRLVYGETRFRGKGSVKRVEDLHLGDGRLVRIGF